MNKATHYGECQACGARQKLPGGRLSLHGYRVKWGFFDGVCMGADHLPFEQSTDLIDACIASATAKGEALEIEAQAVAATTDAIWVKESSGFDRSTGLTMYAWRKLELSAVALTPWGALKWVKHDGRNGDEAVSGSGSTLESKVAYYNRRRAEFLRKQAAETRAYVSWLQMRVKDWAPRELTPVEK